MLFSKDFLGSNPKKFAPHLLTTELDELAAFCNVRVFTTSLMGGGGGSPEEGVQGCGTPKTPFPASPAIHKPPPQLRHKPLHKTQEYLKPDPFMKIWQFQLRKLILSSDFCQKA